jgi:hypothetical protein
MPGGGLASISMVTTRVYVGKVELGRKDGMKKARATGECSIF